MNKPIATTTLGRLEGTWQAKNTIAVFKGVPFAKLNLGKV